jgi:hypothetical protein
LVRIFMYRRGNGIIAGCSEIDPVGSFFVLALLRGPLFCAWAF